MGATAKQLMIMRDGAMINGYLSDPATVADSLGAAFTSILDAGISTPH